MFQSVLIAFAFLATIAHAVFPSGATQLTNQVSATGSLAGYSINSVIPSLFYIDIPENAESLEIRLSQPATSTCNGVELMSSDVGFPCLNFLGSSSYSAPCQYDGLNVGSIATYLLISSSTLYPGDHTFVSGGYLYLSVINNDYYSRNNSCDFTLMVNYTTCPGQIYSYSCGSYTPLSISSSVQSFTSSNQLFKMTLPEMVGHITFQVYSDSIEIDLYGNNRQVNQPENLCQSYDRTNVFGQNGYDFLYSMTCVGVEAGSFYISVSAYHGYQGLIKYSTQVCSGNAVGPYCNATFVDISPVLSGGNSVVQLNSNTNSDGFYGYLDLNTTTPGSLISLWFYGNGTSNTAYFTRGGFPFPSNTKQIRVSQFDYALFFLTPLELNTFAPYYSERIYFFFSSCYGSGTCFFQVRNYANFNGTTTTTASATTTTASTTSTASATATSSATSTTASSTTGAATSTAASGSSSSQASTSSTSGMNPSSTTTGSGTSFLAGSCILDINFLLLGSSILLLQILSI